MASSRKVRFESTKAFAKTPTMMANTASAQDRRVEWDLPCAKSAARSAALRLGDHASLLSKLPAQKDDNSRMKKKSRWTALKEGRVEPDIDTNEQRPTKTICPGLVQALAKDLAAMRSKGLQSIPSTLKTIAGLEKDEELRKWLETAGQSTVLEPGPEQKQRKDSIPLIDVPTGLSSIPSKVEDRPNELHVPDNAQSSDLLSGEERMMPGLYTTSEIIVVVVGLSIPPKKLYIHKDLLINASNSISSMLKKSEQDSKEILTMCLPKAEYHVFVALVDYLYQGYVTLYADSSPRKGPSNAKDLLHAWILASDLGMENAQNAIMDCLRASGMVSRSNGQEISSTIGTDSHAAIRELVDSIQCGSILLQRGTPPYNFLVDRIAHDLLTSTGSYSGSEANTIHAQLESINQLGGHVFTDVLARVLLIKPKDTLAKILNPAKASGCAYHLHSTDRSRVRCRRMLSQSAWKPPLNTSVSHPEIPHTQSLFSSAPVAGDGHFGDGLFGSATLKCIDNKHTSAYWYDPQSNKLGPTQQQWPRDGSFSRLAASSNTNIVNAGVAKIINNGEHINNANIGSTVVKSSTTTDYSSQDHQSLLGTSTTTFSKLTVSWQQCKGTGELPFVPCEDMELEENLSYQTITRNVAYERYSLEELRLADYAANRRSRSSIIIESSITGYASGLEFRFRRNPRHGILPSDKSISSLDDEDDDEEL